MGTDPPHYSSALSDTFDDYMMMRTLPALLSVVFALASLYQFGGIATVELSWLGYTLSQEHAVLVSMATFAVAFASSETMQFESYEDWEKVVIAAGPVLIIGTQYVTAVNDFLLALGDPLGYQLAFLVTIASWGVAVQ
jgi:hypothetical protein